MSPKMRPFSLSISQTHLPHHDQTLKPCDLPPWLQRSALRRRLLRTANNSKYVIPTYPSFLRQADTNQYVNRRIAEDEDAKVAFEALSKQLQHASTGLDITLQKLGMQSGEDRHRILADYATELGYVCDVLRLALPYLVNTSFPISFYQNSTDHNT
jgi:hypothetical protein